jgi:hypothetical protein
MKKPLVVVIIGIVVSLVARGLVAVWSEHTWGLEQSVRVSPFVTAAQFFLTPLVFYPAYQTHKPMSPAKARGLKRFYILVSISFFIVGLAGVASGLGDISVLPLGPAHDASSGIRWLSIFPWMGIGILLLRDPGLFKAGQQQTEQPEA